MKVYIGAKFSNSDKVIHLSKCLEEYGVFNSYNWAACLKEEETKEDLIESSIKEMEAIKDSDCVIFLLPLGRGSHVELGMALACNKNVILCSENEEMLENDPINFYELPEITKVIGDYNNIHENIVSLLCDNNKKNK